MKNKSPLLIVLTVILMLALVACSTEDITYHTIKFDTNGAELMQDRMIADGAKIKRPDDPIKEGYTFAGWYHEDREWDFDNDTVTKDITLRAKFEKNTYLITFIAGNTETGMVVNSGEKISEPEAPYKENHTFRGWYLGNTKWNFASDTVTSDITLTAVFDKLPEYTVSFDIPGIPSQTYFKGGKATPPEEPMKADHVFLGWYLGDEKWDFNTTLTESITLNAKWQPYPEYTVTFDTQDGSAVPDQTVTKGHTATKPDDPTKADHEFTGWYLDGEVYDFNTPIEDNITLTAGWEALPEYTVTFDTQNGSAVPDQTVTKGHTATKPDDPTKADHEFTGWYLDGEVYDFNTPIENNITLTAGWEVLPEYTVTFDTADVLTYDAAYTVADMTILKGEKITAPNNPDIDPAECGYIFLGWYYNGERWDFENDVVTDNMTLTAEVAKALTVTANMGKDASGTSFGKEVIYYVALGEKLAQIPTPDYPSPEHAGVWQFTGWYIYDDVAWNFNDPVTEDITLYAGWAPMLPIHPF